MIEQEVEKAKGNTHDGVASFDLEVAKNHRLKLCVKIDKIQKLLGGDQSKRYQELQDLCASINLKVDYSNLDSVLVQLIDYKPQESDSFSVSDCTLPRPVRVDE